MVVIAARWSMYTETYDGIYGRPPGLPRRRRRQSARYRDFSQGLVARACQDGRHHQRAWDSGAADRTGAGVLSGSECLLRRKIDLAARRERLPQSSRVRSLDQRLCASKAILQNVASGRSATTYVSLDSILCDDQVCRTWEDGEPLYRDTSHLDLSGARVIGRALADMPSLASLFVGPESGFSVTYRKDGDAPML